MNIIMYRLIAGIEFFAYYLIAPAIILLIFDSKQGLLDAECPYCYQLLIYGFFVGLYPFFQIFSAPILGRKTDNLSRKRILQFIHLANVLGYSFFALSGVTHVLFYAFIGLSIPSLIGSAIPILKTSVALQSNPQERSKEFAKFALIKGGTAVFASTLGIFLSLTISFLLSALLSLIALVCTSLLPFSAPLKTFSGSRQNWKAFCCENFGSLTVFFLVFLCYCIFIKFAPLLLADRFSSHWVNYFFLISGVATALNQFVSCQFLQLTPKSIPKLLVILLISITGFCLSPSQAGSTFLLLATLFIFALVTVQIESQLSLIGIAENQGETQGILYSVENASYVLAPIAGAILAVYNSIYAIVLAGIIAGIALMIIHLGGLLC